MLKRYGKRGVTLPKIDAGITKLRFDIIVAMIEKDPKLYDMLKIYFEKKEKQ
jgi:hypothetical protein